MSMKIMHYISKKWDEWGTDGIKLPFVHDPVKKGPSITLLFFYISFAMAVIVVSASSIQLILSNKSLEATFMPVIMMFSGFIFYRLRRLDSISINLEEKSINLSGDQDGQS